MTNSVLDPQIVQEAAQRLMLLHSGEATPADFDAWARWPHQSPAHALAWQRAQRLADALQAVPPQTGRLALESRPQISRRRLLQQLALIVALPSTGWLGWRASPWAEAGADLHTAIGEIRELSLSDGSRLTLNTDSAADLAYSSAERRIVLHRGEVFITSAPDSLDPPRPLRVQTPHGLLRALGTEFGVRLLDDLTQLSVYAGAVEVRTAGTGEMRVIQSGQQIRFDARAAAAPGPANVAGQSWTQGLLVADRLPLAECLAELARYRRGILRCAPAVANVPISGIYQLGNPDQVLRLLESEYGLRVEGRAGWWQTVRAA